jgi:hypothetical protein
MVNMAGLAFGQQGNDIPNKKARLKVEPSAHRPRPISSTRKLDQTKDFDGRHAGYGNIAQLRISYQSDPKFPPQHQPTPIGTETLSACVVCRNR